MSVVLERGDGAHILICKGAVEEIFAVCTRYAIDDEVGALDESHFAAAKETTAKLNADGFRVVARGVQGDAASANGLFRRGREPTSRCSATSRSSTRRRRRAAPAIAALKARGVQVKILTGDNDIVTRKICREVGLPVGSYRPWQRDRGAVTR